MTIDRGKIKITGQESFFIYVSFSFAIIPQQMVLSNYSRQTKQFTLIIAPLCLPLPEIFYWKHLGEL
jgi:hypothetical protein